MLDFMITNSKYIDNKIQMDIPAKVSADLAQKIQEYAKKAYKAVNGAGLSRCDFFVTKDGNVYLNEVNAIPVSLRSMYHCFGKIWACLTLI